MVNLTMYTSFSTEFCRERRIVKEILEHTQKLLNKFSLQCHLQRELPVSIFIVTIESFHLEFAKLTYLNILSKEPNLFMNNYALIMKYFNKGLREDNYLKTNFDIAILKSFIGNLTKVS